MKRAGVCLLLLVLLLGAAVAAQEYIVNYNAHEAGCRDGLYAFKVTYTSGPRVARFEFVSEDWSDSIWLRLNETVYVLTSFETLDIWIELDQTIEYINNFSRCSGVGEPRILRPGHASPPPRALAVVSVPSGALITWDCNGLVTDERGQPLVTPVEAVDLYNEQTGQPEPTFVSVLTLDAYSPLDAGSCTAMADGIALVGRWYSAHELWGCMAVTGDPRSPLCLEVASTEGQADYH